MFGGGRPGISQLNQGELTFPHTHTPHLFNLCLSPLFSEPLKPVFFFFPVPEAKPVVPGNRLARSAPREGGKGCRNKKIIISKIIVVAKALTRRCSRDVGGSLVRLQTAVGLGPAWGSLWEGGGGSFEEGSCVAPPQQNVGSGTSPSLQGLAGSGAGIPAAEPARWFSFLTPGPLGPWWLARLAVVSLNSLESVGSVCPLLPATPRPGPVPPPARRWQMNGGFNEQGRGAGREVLKML